MLNGKRFCSMTVLNVVSIWVEKFFLNKNIDFPINNGMNHRLEQGLENDGETQVNLFKEEKAEDEDCVLSEDTLMHIFECGSRCVQLVLSKTTKLWYHAWRENDWHKDKFCGDYKDVHIDHKDEFAISNKMKLRYRPWCEYDWHKDTICGEHEVGYIDYMDDCVDNILILCAHHGYDTLMGFGFGFWKK
jgi:hypothetical protein